MSICLIIFDGKQFENDRDLNFNEEIKKYN